MKTLLILPPGDSGSFEITPEQWHKNGYTLHDVGEVVRQRAIDLGIGMALEVDDQPNAFGLVTIKWYPTTINGPTEE